MILPAGFTLEPPTPDAIQCVLDNPRPLHEALLDPPSIDFLMQTTFAQIACYEEWPIAFFSMELTHRPGSEDRPFVYYRALATPDAERFPLLLTKIAREFVRLGVQWHPDIGHGCYNIADSPAIGWLELVGFRRGVVEPWDGELCQSMWWPYKCSK